MQLKQGEAYHYRLIYHYHNEYGHVGMTKLITIIRRFFDSPDMTLHVSNYVNRCMSCQLARRTHSKTYGPPNAIISDKFNDMLHLDYFGPLPTGRGGVTTVLVIEDSFTKFVRLYALRVVTATNTISRIEDWISRVRKTEDSPQR